MLGVIIYGIIRTNPDIRYIYVCAVYIRMCRIYTQSYIYGWACLSYIYGLNQRNTGQTPKSHLSNESTCSSMLRCQLGWVPYGATSLHTERIHETHAVRQQNARIPTRTQACPDGGRGAVNAGPLTSNCANQMLVMACLTADVRVLRSA